MSKDKLFPRLGRLLVCLAVLLALAPVATVMAAGFDAMALDGLVTINGAAAPFGTPVTAEIDGDQVASGTTGGEGLADNFYALFIQGEYGDDVELFVHGIEAAESPYTWQEGVRHRNLSITKAHLVVNITAPADGDIFSTEQFFNASATVTNTGLEDASGVTATLVELGIPIVIGAIAAGDTSAEAVWWPLQCIFPGQATITINASGQTPDNNGGFVDIPDDNIESDQVTITQELKSHLQVTDVSSDLTDDTASTLQEFTISATVRNAGEAVANDVTAALTITGGTGTATILSGPDPASVAALTQAATQEFTWEIQCTGSGTVEFLVTPSGTDENTGEPVLEANIETGTLTITQELKGHLTANITAPEDGAIIAFDAEFQVDATISNTGEAGVLGAGATLVIDGPAELQQGETADKDIGDLDGAGDG